MSQAAAQHSAAGSVSAKSPIDPVSVASEFLSSRIFANVRSSSLISSRSGRRSPFSSGTAVLSPVMSASILCRRRRPPGPLS